MTTPHPEEPAEGPDDPQRTGGGEPDPIQPDEGVPESGDDPTAV